MLGGELAVLQAPMFDGLSFDPFALFDDGCGPAEVGVGRRHVVEALVVAAVVVVLDEGLDLAPRGRRAGSSFRAGCGSSGSGASARSCPGSGDGSGAPRTWLMLCASIHSASSPAM